MLRTESYHRSRAAAAGSNRGGGGPPPPPGIVGSAWDRTESGAAGLFGGFMAEAANCWRDRFRVGAGCDLLRSTVMRGRVGLLLSGLALRQRVGLRGQRQALDVYLPGDMIGLETAVLGANATEMRALSPVVLAVPPAAVFSRSLGSQPFAETVVQVLAQQHRRLENRVVRLGLLDAPGRIAALVIDLAQRLRAEPGEPLPLPLTQRDLAALLGLTAIHVSRVLRSFAEQNVLTFRRGVVTIHDMERLLRLACRGGSVDAALLGL